MLRQPFDPAAYTDDYRAALQRQGIGDQPQVRPHQGQPGGLHRRLAAPTDRNPEVGRGQGRGRSGGSDEPRGPKEQKPSGEAREAVPAGDAGNEGQAGGGNRRRRRGGSGRSSGGAGEQVVEKSSVPVEEQAKIAEEFLVGLVRSFGYEGTATSVIEEDDITVSIEGEGLGLLIGPQGATMTAIEELSRAVMHRHCGTGTARLHVDVSGYRAARRQALAELRATSSASR